MTKTATLGDEFDADLKTRLVEKMKALGAKPVSSQWSVAGSQELNSFSVTLEGEVLDIVSETYVGLSISGPDELVDEIAGWVGNSEWLGKI